MLDFEDPTTCAACGSAIEGARRPLAMGEVVVSLCETCAANPDRGALAATRRARGLIRDALGLLDIADRLDHGEHQVRGAG